MPTPIYDQLIQETIDPEVFEVKDTRNNQQKKRDWQAANRLTYSVWERICEEVTGGTAPVTNSTDTP